MEIRIDGDNGVPVYRQIVDTIKHQVATGARAAGERLPTVRQLAEDLQVDRNTIVRAYRVLDREGVISAQQGRGTFIRAHAEHPELTRHRRERLDLLVGESIARALSLGYTPEEIEQAFTNRMSEWRRARAKPHGRSAAQRSGAQSPKPD
jgi:GntR family transcriptional regulator